MAKRGKKTDQQKLAEANAIFTESLEALATAPDQLIAAVNYGIEGVLNQLAGQACAEVDLDVDLFAEEFEKNGALHKRIAELFHPDALAVAKTAAQRKDAERHLNVLRYVLSGKEPAEWVWQTMDPNERNRLRAFRNAGGEDDPELLARVERALEKLADHGTYGKCEGCQNAIVTERLSLIPWAERCTTCQRAVEPALGAAGGPRVPLWMFFEGGKPVPPDKRLVS